MKYLRPDDKRTYLYVGKRKTSNNQAVSSYGPSTIVFLELLLHTLRVYQQGREHWYRKKAAAVGQNGRFSALCNFFSF